MISDAYTKADIAATYREVGVKRGQTVYVTSDLGRLMKFEIPGKSAILEAHLDVLQDLVGGHGNIVVPTASMQICNTEIPFDLAATPSHQVGIFSEFIRTRAGALRSFHPFVSYTALGHDKRAFTEDVSGMPSGLKRLKHD